MSTHRLDAWVGGRRLGTLSYHDDTGRFAFEYDPQWVRSGSAFPVIGCIEDPVVIKQILAHLQHKAEAGEPRALPESRAPPAGLAQGLFD